MNNQAAEFLGAYAPFYWAICVSTHKAIGVDAQDIFDEIVVQPRVTQDQLESYIRLLCERVPHLGYAQVQKHVFRIMGYRSSGLAYEIRRTYSTLRNLEELTHPNLWHEFLHVYHDDSVFGMRDYSKDECSLHYLEFLYEPRLRNLIDHDGIPEDLEDAFLTMLNISQQKTMSEAMARTLATQIEHELGGRVRHCTAMNLVAIGLGYKTWPLALAACAEGSIPNMRMPSRFAPLPLDADPWLAVPTSRPVPSVLESRV